MKTRYAIIGIGTELTTGQILNRNAQWISKKIKDLGDQVCLHTVVPDDRSLIQAAFDFCHQQQINTVFVTGGLGPTSDDFTREVVADWLGLTLQWHEEAWQHVGHYFAERKQQPKEIQRQQCYFPQGATMFKNSRGTAFGFAIHGKNTQFFVLPGPPLEIEAMWDQVAKNYLQGLTQNIDKLVTRSWECIGVGESFIAETVEKIMNPKLFELGYRAHPPYVEFKVTYPQSQTKNLQPLLQQVEEVLRPYIALRDGEDAALLFKQLTQGKKICIWDNVSRGQLNERLLGSIKSAQHISFYNGPIRPEKNSQIDLIFSLRALDSNTALCEIILHKQHRVQRLETPYLGIKSQERSTKYFLESALLFWVSQLKEYT